MWIVVNRSHVNAAHFAEGSYRSRGAPIIFGSLGLEVNRSHVNAVHFAEGSYHSRGAPIIFGSLGKSERRILRQWIVQGRIAILSGFWGKNTCNCVKNSQRTQEPSVVPRFIKTFPCNVSAAIQRIGS